MTHSLRKFTAEQKAAIVRRHLKGKESIATIAEELSIQPTQIHQWVAVVMEQAEKAFEKTAKSDKASKLAEAKINALKEQQIRRLQRSPTVRRPKSRTMFWIRPLTVRQRRMSISGKYVFRCAGTSPKPRLAISRTLST